jgi:hypothetical protein
MQGFKHLPNYCFSSLFGAHLYKNTFIFEVSVHVCASLRDKK